MSNIGKWRTYLHENWYDVLVWTVFTLGVIGLLVFRLNRLTGGVTAAELANLGTPSFHHLWHQPLDIPLQLPQLLVVKLFGVQHVAHLARVSNAILGLIAIMVLTRLIYLWHGHRSALMAGCLFAASAWTLHVSRLSSPDILYLLALPTLLLFQAALHRAQQTKRALYGSALAWSLLLTVPGLLWCVALSVFWIRADLKRGFTTLSKWWQRGLFVIAGLAWVPLVAIAFYHKFSVSTWLGLPGQLTTASLPKHIAAVPLHLLVRGPEYPQLWLGKLPILDIFSLAVCLVGIYFYARHPSASRSRILGSFSVLGIVLIGLGGPVPLSLLVPLLFVLIGTGLTYLLRLWLQIFPANPIARNFGVGVLAAAVALSCLYNVRSYFVAWPHNPVAVAVFHSKR